MKYSRNPNKRKRIFKEILLNQESRDFGNMTVDRVTITTYTFKFNNEHGQIRNLPW